eukprot:CCRYP_008651-RB/>CCRYP_008651-RB protein AED:0.19 eAED:0.19 QI:169/1/1/1/0.33/0.25/4/2059/221
MFGLAQRLTPILNRLASPTAASVACLSLSTIRGIKSAAAPAFWTPSIRNLSHRETATGAGSSTSSLTLSHFQTKSVFSGPSFGLANRSTLVGNANSLLDMSRQMRGFATAKHKRVIKQSKGFRGRANRCYRVAIRRLEKSWQYAYRDRKVKKREFRKLWIQRLNAGVRQHDVSYSNFINMQSKSGVLLDRKILSGLAMYEPFSFKAVVDVVKMTAAAGTGK